MGSNDLYTLFLNKTFSNSTNCTAFLQNGLYLTACQHLGEQISSLLSEEDFVALAVVNALGCAVGFVGNLTVLVILATNSRMQSQTNSFIASLTVADLLVCMVIQTMHTYLYSNKEIAFNDPAMFSFYAFCYFTTNLSSIFSLLAVSADRFICLRRPLRYQSLVTPKRTALCIVLMWSFSLVMATLRVSIPKSVISYMLLVIFVLVTLAMIFTNAYIFTIVQKQRRTIDTRMDSFNSSSDQGNTENNYQRQRKSTITALLFVGTYLLFWLPTLITFLYTVVVRNLAVSKTASYSAERALLILETIQLLNSSVNWLVYWWKSKEFRNSVYRVFHPNTA